MSSIQQERLSELDRVLDSVQVTPDLSEELFALVDLLDRQPALRRALTDPGAEPEARSTRKLAPADYSIALRVRTAAAEERQ